MAGRFHGVQADFGATYRIYRSFPEPEVDTSSQFSFDAAHVDQGEDEQDTEAKRESVRFALWEGRNQRP